MTDADDALTPLELGPADDQPHVPSGHPWEAETWWFSFFAPERGLGGWLYALVRANLGTCAGGMWVWDPSSHLPWDARYFRSYTSLPLRRPLEAPRLEFPSTFSVETLRPLHDYRLRYDDTDAGVSADLVFAATTPAFGIVQHRPPFTASAHFDQAGRVTGTLQLAEESVAIDCHALRDRSWGPRSERVVARMGYCWIATPDEAVLCYSFPADGRLEVQRGILWRDGVVAPIVGGERVERRHPEHGYVLELDIEAVDAEGRTISAQGRATSRLAHPRAAGVNWISIVEWTVGGQRCFGEDQDVWPVDRWRDARRASTS